METLILVSFQTRPLEAYFPEKTPVITTSVIMDPVSRSLDREILDSDDGREAVADLKSQLGALQIGGGRDLLMDDYDIIEEKPEVATITPDDSADEPELEPRADDCRSFEAWCTVESGSTTMSDRELDDAMKSRVLPKIPDLEIESEAVHTWNIENYRHLSKKERGPKFDCGGHPWYAIENFDLARL